LNSGTTRAEQASLGAKCLDPRDQVDALVSLDLKTGAFKWSRRSEGPDTYNGACPAGLSTCPDPEGMDADFSSAPNLIYLSNFVGANDDRGGTSNQYLLGAGQKSGIYWAINPADGGLFWYSYIGQGEIKWGTAVNTSNGTSVLIANYNTDHNYNLLAGLNGRPQYWNAGSWGSLDLRTGKMTWQVPAYGDDLKSPTYGASAAGAISFSNGVGFAADSSGYMTAFNATTGKFLWLYNTGANLDSAPAIFNDTVYWGAGQAGTKGGMLYAFSVVPPK
jgi:polyvinyl alcohol dehydrogenase (cytochrome)